MALPFLPQVKGLGQQSNSTLDKIFRQEADTSRMPAFNKNFEFPGNATRRSGTQTSTQAFGTDEELPTGPTNLLRDVGQGVARQLGDFGAGLANRIVPGDRDFRDVSQNKFAPMLFGGETKRLGNVEAGQEIASLFGDVERGDETSGIERLGFGALGFTIGSLDAATGGSGKRKVAEEAVNLSQDIFPKLVARYGPTLAKKMDEIGDMDLARKALIPGGENEVAQALRVGQIEVTAQKLADTMRDVSRAVFETEELRSAERSRRASQSEAIFQAGEGSEEAAKAARALQEGELPQAGFAPAADVRIQQEEIEQMFKHIRQTDDLSTYERFRAEDGLAKILGDPRFEGKVPQQSELDLLRKTFGEPFSRYARNLSGSNKWQEWKKAIASVANVPRAIMSSADLSAVLRQSVVLSVSHPIRAGRALKESLKYFVNDDYFNASMDAINSGPMAKLRKRANLDFTSIGKEGVELTDLEEAFQTDLAQRIPVIGKLVKASERNFVGYLNKMRADTFDNIARDYMEMGLDPTQDIEEFKALADFLNNATGRGRLADVPGIGQTLEESAPLINSVLYSPKLLMSRFNLLNPRYYMKLTPETRKYAMKSITKTLGAGMSALGFAKLVGGDNVEVGADPTDSDFGKIKIGNTRYDVWGGFQQWAVLYARVSQGLYQDTFGDGGDDGPFGSSAWDSITRFMKYKTAPTPGLIRDLLDGQNAINQDLTFNPLDGIQTNPILSRMMPLYIQDMIEIMQDEGVLKGAGMSVPGVFGVGIQNYARENVGEEKIKLPKGPSLPSLPSLPKI